MAEEGDELRHVLDDLEAAWLLSTEHERPDGLLYHYTDTQGFHGIFTNRCVWATDYRLLNDRREMVCGEDAFKEVAIELSKDIKLPGTHRILITELSNLYEQFKLTRMFNPFVVSFSEEGDLLSQWRAYSADGAGYSIGFDPRALPPPVRVGGPITCLLVRCRYGTDWLKASARAMLLKLAHQYVEAVGSIFRDGDERRLYSSFVASGLRHAGLLIARVKDAAFSEEREFRVLVLPIPERAAEAIEYRVAARGLVPHIQLEMALGVNLLDVGRVCVGPAQDGALGTTVASGFLKRLGYGEDLVHVSRVPYRGGR